MVGSIDYDITKEHSTPGYICPQILGKEEQRKNGAYQSFFASPNASLVAITEIGNFTLKDWMSILDIQLRRSRVSERETENGRKKGEDGGKERERES
ncbi:uncharacterized protein EAF01_000429 [Botrytis porri]|uniref:Uncharacterized protein n=1 Tax=Botrytis porri TaxID=87229 RepID=A0A4Z1KWF1_9HELO|nr:uncharacterized protein EAF01_000429 [Botrytis porri]KAF7914023.1 hypothetical protein EAF01_000429 [Botrytis porri]TGO88874.1 hypothetical protein BPOR_0137g00150 [Botrytis porri]